MELTSEQVHALAPFTATLGVEFELITAEQVVAGLAVTPERCTGVAPPSCAVVSG